MEPYRTTNVTNYGVYNSGTVHGNVVNSIKHAFANSTATSEPERQALEAAIIKLADVVKEHAGSIAAPEEALDRVESIGKEAAKPHPSQSVLLTFLDILTPALGRVPLLLESLDAVRECVVKLVR